MYISKRTQTVAISFLVMAGFIVNACKHDGVALGTDMLLYDMAVEDTGYVWYKFSDAALDISSESAHGLPKLRTRYNAIAATMLDSEGRIQPGIQFPEGSLVVKELLEDDLSLVRYAILYKNATSADADDQGWVWGYLNASGTVRTSSSEKGSGCSGCHSQGGNIDYMLMNKFFP